MKIVHIESGLGNQMLSFCEYLALKKIHPYEEIFIENIIYDIPECNEVICQWNGYELERLFAVNAPNIKNKFLSEQWNEIIEEVRASKFWEKRWNYAPYITAALNGQGMNITNIRGDFEAHQKKNDLKHGIIGKIRKSFFEHTLIGNTVRRYLTQNRDLTLPNKSFQDKIFYKGNNDVFTGQWLLFKFNGTGIERIHDDIIRTFVFQPFSDEKNRITANLLDTTNSVFIHARRGDMLSANGWCYKYGYFKRAVKHVRKNVEDPLFVFFTNTGSIEWCKEHTEDIFGLKKGDKVIFVDWNTGNQSFRDMQLMTHCKHGIITNSTFGWWGAYLIQNPQKITISPLAEINTTYHC